MPVRVERPHYGGGSRGNRARRRHHNRWATDGRDDNRDLPRMADDDAIDSQALPGGDIEHSFVQTSISHRCGYVVRWQNHRCGTWTASRELAGTSSASQERSVGSAGNRVVTWRPTRMLTGEATEPLDGRSQLESS